MSLTIDNDGARQLMSFGVTPKQIANLRSLRISGIPCTSDGVCTRDIVVKEDIFFEPHKWVCGDWWSASSLPGDPSCSCQPPGVPSYELFHAESDNLKALAHDEESPYLVVLKLAWLRTGALVFPMRTAPSGTRLSRDIAMKYPIGSMTRLGLVLGSNVDFAHEKKRYETLKIAQMAIEQNPLQGNKLDLNISDQDGHVSEDSLMSRYAKDANSMSSPYKEPKQNASIPVYSDDPVMRAHLENGASRYSFEKDPTKCDYWYTLRHARFGTSSNFPPSLKGVNQFPFESALIRKDIALCQVVRACQKYFKSSFFLPAYDLETELLHFWDDLTKQRRNWVIKPAQQARSAGIVFTDKMSVVLSAMSSPGGDKVAQLHVDRPLLYSGRKFDLRTLVVVKQFKPELIAWANLDATYARVAREEYDINSLNRKLGNLTVSKYDVIEDNDVQDEEKTSEPTIVQRSRLKSTLNAQGKWEKLAEPRGLLMMRQMLLAASHFIGENRHPSQGACYGFDWILTDEYVPKLIEVNFGPDLSGPCQLYHTGLLDDILLCLTSSPEEIPEFSPSWIRL